MSQLTARKKGITQYLTILVKHSVENRIEVVSGHLAYVSLLSLVPIISIIFSLFTVFPIFAQASDQLREFIFTALIPTSGETIQLYVEKFIENSHKLTMVGIIGLVLTALLLIAAIDDVINKIWRVDKKRPFVYSVAVYWMVLTLGPLFLGGSLAVSSLIISKNNLAESVTTFFDEFFWLFPLFLSFITFWLLYNVVPNVRVPIKDSAIGAFIAAVLFEISKKFFAVYVMAFPSYQLIYGMLAVIPILLFWIYISWFIVLLGAEITVSLAEYRCLTTKASTPLACERQDKQSSESVELDEMS